MSTENVEQPESVKSQENAFEVESTKIENDQSVSEKADSNAGLSASEALQEETSSGAQQMESVQLEEGTENEEQEEPLEEFASKSQQVSVKGDRLVELGESASVSLVGVPPAEEIEEEPPAEVEPPFKKNRRIQVPSADTTRGIYSIEPSPKKPPKRKFHDPTPQKIGVLVGISCKRLSKITGMEAVQLEMLKHFSVVFLFSRFQNPHKWDAFTFKEIRSLGDATDNNLVMDKFPITYMDLIYEMTLTDTIVKGRINSKDAAPPNFKNALIDQLAKNSGLVIKCENHYMLAWKVQDGYYLYDPCLNEVSQLLFFNSLILMKKFIVHTKELKDRSKFHLSKIFWSAVDDGHIRTLKRKSNKPTQFVMRNSSEALLMGDRYLKESGYKLESLRICLNAIELAQSLDTISWNAANLSKLFDGDMSDKSINKVGIFLCEEGPEESYLLEKVRLIRLEVAFGSSEREELEKLLNRVLAIRMAVIVKIEEYYFALWSHQKIVYWFSPFRFDALGMDPDDLDDKGCFLYAFNTLQQMSRIMFEYLIELGLFPRHQIRLFTVDDEPFGVSPRLPLVDSTDSLNRSELEIHLTKSTRPRVLISYEDLPPLTLSEAKLCRLIMAEVVDQAETGCD
ncbi:uncharacterized protein LOC129757031 [Uranotaenia lowii]|uniref:uncharacterized protein LOC129757031 n=1 Tax=Uranotaenia lowii TaxID=190385 RepID=UPI00247A4D34|nr:uncharacterized protein LOC129757031 [Uranotaenia lowii]